MKKLLPLLALLLVGYLLAGRGGLAPGEEDRQPTVAGAPGPAGNATSSLDSDAGARAIAEAFAQQRSNLQVASSGRVERVLADDNDGSRHQRIIVRLSHGQTVLIAHNIDLAPRIESLQPGDRIAFSGEYEWNRQGGVIHWTHRDPAGQHVAGWLEVAGRRYQ